MKRIHTHTLRTVHKWVGLVIGIQFLLWTLSGFVMAILPMHVVAGGERAGEPAGVQIVPAQDRWPRIQQQIGNDPAHAVSLRRLLGRPVVEIATAEGPSLFLPDGLAVRLQEASRAAARKGLIATLR